MSDIGVKIGPNGPQFDTSALRTAGKALLSQETPAAPVSPTPASTSSSVATPTNVVVTEVKQAQVEQPVAPEAAAPVEAQITQPQEQLVDLPDDALVKVTVNGEEQVMKWGDAKKGVTLHRTFTQNQQKLRAEQKEFESQRTTLLQKAERADKLARLITDPDLFARYAVENPLMAQALAKKFGTTVQAATAEAAPAAQAAVAQAAANAGITPPANAEELVSFGEMHNTVSSQLRELQSRVDLSIEEKIAALDQIIEERADKVVEKKLALLRDAHEVNQFNQQIDKAIDSNLEANPALKVIPRIRELLRFEVREMQPETPEDMLEAINIVSRGIVEGLDQTYNQSRSAALIAKERLAKEGIEPPGGSAPNVVVQPQVPNYLSSDGKMDWQKMKERGKALLNSR